MFSTIVIGFDASSQAHDALVLGEALADADTEIVVCCVHPPELADQLVPDESLRLEAHERLRAARTHLEGRSHVRFEVRGAFSPGAGLHDEAERSHADLLVVGGSHRGAIGRVIPGSVTRQALHAPPCAVAVAPFGLHLREQVSIAEIGVAFNGEPESHVALEAAAAIARDRHARLRMLFVVDATLVSDGWASSWVYPEIRDDMRHAAEDIGQQALSALEGVEASLEVLDGIAAQELVLASSRLDLLVLGSRGYGPLRRALLGTVSGRVAEATACPVLVVARGAARPAEEAAA